MFFYWHKHPLDVILLRIVFGRTKVHPYKIKPSLQLYKRPVP